MEQTIQGYSTMAQIVADTGGLERAGLPATVIEEIKRRDLAKIPLGRRGTPEEAAAWIVALADPSAGWITRRVLSVDGGMSIS